MLNTARFVAEAGGQAELVLRARQATNPHFAFLRPGSALQPYFRWLVRVQPQVRGDPSAMGERDRSFVQGCAGA